MVSSKSGRTKPKKQEQHRSAKSANAVSSLAVVGLVVLAVVDLLSSNDVPNFIYYGLIGASLGARIDDIRDWIGGGKR